MSVSYRGFKPISLVVMGALFAVSVAAPPANAALVGTQSVVDGDAGGQVGGARQRIKDFLQRQEVQQEMRKLGIDPGEAQSRVAALSDREVARIAGRLDQLPAGGDGGLGTIVGAALLVFIILLITDIAGLTHVFPFVTHHR